MSAERQDHDYDDDVSYWEHQLELTTAEADAAHKAQLAAAAAIKLAENALGQTRLDVEDARRQQRGGIPNVTVNWSLVDEAKKALGNAHQQYYRATQAHATLDAAAHKTEERLAYAQRQRDGLTPRKVLAIWIDHLREMENQHAVVTEALGNAYEQYSAARHYAERCRDDLSEADAGEGARLAAEALGKQWTAPTFEDAERIANAAQRDFDQKRRVHDALSKEMVITERKVADAKRGRDEALAEVVNSEPEPNALLAEWSAIYEKQLALANAIYVVRAKGGLEVPRDVEQNLIYWRNQDASIAQPWSDALSLLEKDPNTPWPNAAPKPEPLTAVLAPVEIVSTHPSKPKLFVPQPQKRSHHKRKSI